MFTGLIREFARVVRYENNYLELASSLKPKIGDSIAINGVCLTVIAIKDGNFQVELSAETRAIMAVENLRDFVHVEPAMRLDERLEGHIVQGHIDTIGVIKSIEKNENASDFYISIKPEFEKFIVPKGSIAIDGVSLTVNSVNKAEFRLTIISHTLAQTLFSSYKIGRKVNIETDMFARYIYHMFGRKQKLDWASVDKMMALY
ncbi:MAG: riboflavin synthase [Sulfurospirillum sp.]|nr:riboflavin synthase [Sulfurospirillum sp.]